MVTNQQLANINRKREELKKLSKELAEKYRPKLIEEYQENGITIKRYDPR